MVFTDLKITQIASSTNNCVRSISANSVDVLETGERAIGTQRVSSNEHTWKCLRWRVQKKVTHIPTVVKLARYNTGTGDNWILSASRRFKGQT